MRPNSDNQILFMQTADLTRYRILLDISSRTVKEYCARHGFLYESFLGIWRGAHPWQATYNRIPLLCRLLEAGFTGWVCYMDADACVVDLEFDLRNYLVTKNSYALIIEPCDHTSPWWNVNAGVFLINLGHPTARAIVQRWSEFFNEISDAQLRDAIAWEQLRDDQSMLQGCLRTIPEAEACTHIEHGFMNYGSGTFIKQFLRAGGGFADRVQRLQVETDGILGASYRDAQSQQFSGKIRSPDIAAMQEEAARAIYRVLLLREPDPIGLGHAIHAFRNGKSIEDSLRSTLQSREFARKSVKFIEKYVTSEKDP